MKTSSRRPSIAWPSTSWARPYIGEESKRRAPLSYAASTTWSATCWRSGPRSKVSQVPRPTTGTSTPVFPRLRRSILWRAMPATSLLEAPELAAERIDARASGENFPVASGLAPRHARPHLRAVYGFARLVDNHGDEAHGDRMALLDEHNRELDGSPRTEIMQRLHETIDACGLPLDPFRRLIEANRIDQRKTRYANWEEVREYCTYSADPVGRLVLAVYGRAEDEELLRMSDSICTGLQLVNFLQDPPRDRALGRVYLPQNDLSRFGVADEDLAGPLTDEIVALLRYEGDRARSLLEAGLPLAKALGGRAGLSVALYARGGLAAIDALERAGWDVFTRRPAPTKWTFAGLAFRELFRRSKPSRPTPRRTGSRARPRGTSPGGSVSARARSGGRSPRSTHLRAASTT